MKARHDFAARNELTPWARPAAAVIAKFPFDTDFEIAILRAAGGGQPSPAYVGVEPRRWPSGPARPAAPIAVRALSAEQSIFTLLPHLDHSHLRERVLRNRVQEHQPYGALAYLRTRICLVVPWAPILPRYGASGKPGAVQTAFWAVSQASCGRVVCVHKCGRVHSPCRGVDPVCRVAYGWEDEGGGPGTSGPS